MPGDIELLEAEIDTLWARDARGRLVRREPGGRAAPHLAVAIAPDGKTIVAVGAAVPNALALAVREAAAAVPPARAGGVPAAVGRCREILEGPLGALVLTSGPSYVVPGGTAFASRATVHRSDDAGAGAFHFSAPAEANWSAEEWRLLLAGALGPWAIATVGGEVAAICHSARLAPRGAEAGVWTHPRYRGQGHAAAVTAAWASLIAPSGRYAFYSTAAENLSSQRVAARLKLRPIGWIWQLATGASDAP